jgi:DNA-binding transcriptional LysR family regulator
MSAGGIDVAIGLRKRDPGLRVAPLYRDPPGFAAAAMAAAGSDLVAFMPRRVAVALGSRLAVRIVELPVEDLGHEMWLAWHERTHKDPAAACLRRVILDTLRAADGPVVKVKQCAFPSTTGT